MSKADWLEYKKTLVKPPKEFDAVRFCENVVCELRHRLAATAQVDNEAERLTYRRRSAALSKLGMASKSVQREFLEWMEGQVLPPKKNE